MSDSAEHVGLGALADAVLQLTDEHGDRRPWRAVLEAMEAYPSGKMLPALKPPRTQERPRRLVAVRWELEGDPRASTPLPVALQLCAGKGVARVQLGDDAEAPERMTAALFNHSHRGALLAFPDGAALTFAVFVRRYARHMVAQGFTLEPLTAGATIRGLIIRKAKHSWVLCDVGVMTGLEQLGESAFVDCFDAAGAGTDAPVRRLWRALDSWQRLSLEHFGAAASTTVGRSAIRAASRHLGNNQWLWRAHPLAVAMLRAGGGYRGGYAAAQHYSGDAWRVDMNKAYTWALGEQLPLRLGLLHKPAGTIPRPGIYMCRVWGTGLAPLYLGAWQEDSETFERVLWHGGDTFAVLTATEITAVRDLGYFVVPGIGLEYLNTFTMRGFVANVAGVASLYGRGSAPERIARAYGVSVYGKLAERPERDQVMYAAERPSEAWWPYLSNTGEDIDDLWRTTTIAHRPHQHVDAASEITALVRGRLYGAIATVRRAGGTVPHADTDGFLSSIDPAGVFGEQGTAPGLWRVDAEAQRTIVWGRKGYSYGDDVRVAGASGVTADQAERILQGAHVTAQMQQRRTPFGSAPLYESLVRQVRAV